MKATDRKRTSTAFKLAVVCAAPLVGWLLLEVALRVRIHLLNQGTLSAAFAAPASPAPGGRVSFRDIIRPHRNDRIIYELRPGLDVLYKDGRLTTNSLGFRGREQPIESDPRTITIVGLGGSHMFGHGVSDEHVYTLLLETMLRERYPEHSWRVINTGVPSYGVVTKVEVLREKGLAFEPDLVLLDVDRNNLDLPNYIRIEEDPLDLRRSFVVDFWRELEGRKRETQRRYGDLVFVDASDKRDWAGNVKSDPSKVPAQFRALIGWAPFHAAMDELARLGRERGFEVVTFAYLDLDINAQLIAEANARGLHGVCFMQRVERHLEQTLGGLGFTAERYLRSDLVVSQGNQHPSVRLHQLTAQWLLEELEARGVIARLLAEHAALDPAMR